MQKSIQTKEKVFDMWEHFPHKIGKDQERKKVKIYVGTHEFSMHTIHQKEECVDCNSEDATIYFEKAD